MLRHFLCLLFNNELKRIIVTHLFFVLNIIMEDTAVLRVSAPLGKLQNPEIPRKLSAVIWPKLLFLNR